MHIERAAALLGILSLPPPDDEPLFRLMLELICMVIQLPPDPLHNIRHRVSGDQENNWMGRDVFRVFSVHRYEFYEATGETPETMLQIVDDVRPALFRETGRQHTMSPRNRLLLFLLWIRSYPTYSMLALIFDISIGTIGNELNNFISVMWETYVHELNWPTIQEWQNMRGNWTKLPDAVGAIDGTSHEIYIPQTEPQELYYSGYRHFHCMHTIMIVDNNRILRYVRSGFLGHQNDAQIFNMLPKIGPNEELPFPDNCLLLGDKIFSNNYPIMTPYKRDEINRKPQNMQRKCKKLNAIISSLRITVEHAIREVKIFRSTGTLWRHPRHKLQQTVEVCAALAVRRKRLFQH